MKPVGAAALLALLGAGACAPRTLPPSAFARGVVEVPCCGGTGGAVTLTYLGVGGWLMEAEEVAILTAPLFSNPSLLETGLAPISADPARIEHYLPDVRDVTAILVGHGHYDHLMDVPYILEHRAPAAVVYGNATVAHQLAPWGFPEGRVQVVEVHAGSVERPGTWIPIGPRARAMPLLSDHAPHLAGMVLYSGERTVDMEHRPRSAEEWLDGRTLAWLVDVLDADGGVALRIYYQDAVAAEPFGLVPPLDDGVGVDVAILVPATYAEVDWHPEAFVENAEPRVVLLAHWEDLFEKPASEPEPVAFTLLPDFVARLERALPEGALSYLPEPGTVFRLVPRGGPSAGTPTSGR